MMIDNRSQDGGVQNRTHRLIMNRRRLQGKQGWGGLVSIPNVLQRLVRGRRRVGQLGEK